MSDPRSHLVVMHTGLMTIENLDSIDGPTTFEGIPPEWEIKSDEIRLKCVDGLPIELGRCLAAKLQHCYIFY